MMSPESLAAADGNIVRWFEQEFGGTVVGLARQTRWRPVSFATVDRGGTRHELVVRGDRTDMPLIFPLSHEMTFQRLLGEHGIPVATVWGWIDEPMAYVMDRVAGQEHFGDTSDEDRAATVDDYLARVRLPGRILDLGDVLVVATAAVRGLAMATRNTARTDKDSTSR